MEGTVEFVNLFQTQVKGIFEILLDVAVSEITHIFQGSLSKVQNRAGPVAFCAKDDGDTQLLASRLSNALKNAIRAHTETTDRTPNTTSSGSVNPEGEVGGEMDVNIKDEIWDMNLQIVDVGVFKDGTVVSLGSSMEKNAEQNVLHFTQPSATSEDQEPHCIRRECSGTTIQSPRSDDDTFSTTERLPGQLMKAGTSYTPRIVLIKQEEEIEPLKCISVNQVKDLEPDSIVEKLEILPVAVSSPVDMVKPAEPLERPEEPTDRNIPDSNLEDEPGNAEILELQEKLLMQDTQLTPQAQPVTQKDNIKMTLRQQPSTHVLTQKDVNIAPQTNTFQNPEPEEKQQRRGAVLRGHPGHSVYPTRNVRRHELEKYLRPCSVRLEDVRRRLKVARLGKRNLRICLDCGKAFFRKHKLRWHQRLVHTGEKPYSCSQCSRTFSLKKNLTRHKKSHTGEKPYSCMHCVKRFRCNAKLKTHMRFHTGEKPFGCGLCGKKYRVLKNFKIHVTTTHPNANPLPGHFLFL